jgi:hypothetical protein
MALPLQAKAPKIMEKILGIASGRWHPESSAEICQQRGLHAEPIAGGEWLIAAVNREMGDRLWRF